MPCSCSVLPYFINVHVLLFGYCHLITAQQQRFKRQTLPTDHIMVHSFNSNVSIADWVIVISDESRIEFREKYLHGEIWSGNSRLDFQPYGQSENLSAQSNVLSIFELPQAVLQTKCEQIQMFLRANRSTDGHSYIEYKADHDVNLILSNGITQVNAIGGRWAHVMAITWKLPVVRRIIIGSNISSGLNRQLRIASINNNYNMDITLFDAQMQMLYGNITVQMSSDYRFLRISSGLYTVDLRTVLSPFEMIISDQEMIVRCMSERAVVRMHPNSSNIIINTDQFSRAIIDRGSGSIILGGQEVRPAGEINLLSMQLNILLKSGDISSIHASANRSQITMQTTSTNMASTASHHDIDIVGGRTSLHAFTGNVSMNIIANAHREPLPTMLAPFPTPQDNFRDIGPILDNLDYNLKNRNFSGNNAIPPTQIPHTEATGYSVSAEASNFQTGSTAHATISRPVPETSLDGAFTIPSFPWMTVINPSDTFPSVTSEQWPLATISTSVTASGTPSRFRSSTESAATQPSAASSTVPPTTERTTTVTSGTPSSTATIASTTTVETTVLTGTSTAKRTQTTSTMTFRSKQITPTTPSPIKQTTTTLPSPQTPLTVPPPSTQTTPTTVPTLSITTIITVLPSSLPLPAIEVGSSEIPEALITGAPVTRRPTQQTPTTTTSSSSSSTEEIDSGGGTWEIDENRDSEQTEFIEFSWDTKTQTSTILTTTVATTITRTTKRSDTGQLAETTTQRVRSTTCIEIPIPSEKQNTPLFTKEPTIVAISEATLEPIVIVTDRSIGSKWTPFAAPPFEFPPTDPSPSSSTSIPDRNFMRQDDTAENVLNSGSPQFSRNSKSDADTPHSVSMVDALKSIFGEIVRQNSSSGTENMPDQENSEFEFEQQQNLSSSKFKRALPGIGNEEIYELQLKISPNIDLTTPNFRQELLWALKKFVLFSNLYERLPVVNENMIRIKITDMERNGDYLKVLYTVTTGTERSKYTSDCDNNELMENVECVRNHGFSSMDLAFVVFGIITVVLLSVGALLVRYKKYEQIVRISPYLNSCYPMKN